MQTSILSSPYERQCRVHDFWPCIMRNQSAMLLLLPIYDVLTAFVGEHTHVHLVAALSLKPVNTVQEAVAGIYLSYRPIKGANAMFIDLYDQAPHRMPKMHAHASLTRRWRSFWRWGMVRAASFFAYKDNKLYHYVWPLRNHFLITWLIRTKIVDSPLMLDFRLPHGACRFLFCL